VRVDLDELVDVHFYVQPLVGRLEHDVIEDNVKDRNLAFWIGKQLRFAERQAVEELRGRSGAGTGSAVPPRLLGSPDQRVLRLKEVWRRLPRYVRPFLLFGYRYVIRLGFLDGKEGFLYHFTQALLYRLAVDVRMEELEAEHRPRRLAEEHHLPPGSPALARRPGSETGGDAVQ
jgi:hypothetical protein